MASEAKAPETLMQAIRFFSDPDICVAYVAKLRWPDGPVCPACEGREHSYLTTRRIWKCKSCKKQFSVKVGTIFEDSRGVSLNRVTRALTKHLNCDCLASGCESLSVWDNDSIRRACSIRQWGDDS